MTAPGPTGFVGGTLLRVGAVATMLVLLQVGLISERADLVREKVDYGNRILLHSWSINELLNETRNLETRLYGYALGQATIEEVRLAFDLVWSRIDALDFVDRIEIAGLPELRLAYRDFLDRRDPLLFGDPAPPRAVATPVAAEARALAGATRDLWSRQFNQNRSKFLHDVSDAIAADAADFEILIALVAMAGLLYLSAELFLANRARRREGLLLAAANSASQVKSAFLANMSHEVRTPLNGVLGAAELLEETALDADQRRLLATIEQSGEQLLAIVNQVLDLTKIEAGRLELEELPVDLRAHLDQCLAMFEKAGREKGLRLCCEVAGDLPSHVCGDPLRLRQIVTNLLSNAVKFTAEGEVVLRARRVGAGDGAGRLEISVSDTGIGIPAQALERVFEAFVQSDPSDTRRFGGTGLGLTISRHLALAMGGDLTLENAPGQGAVARVLLPLVPGAAPAPAQGEARPAAGRPCAPLSMTVLLVEDNATNRMLAERMIAPLVARFETAANGREGLERWRRGGIDLIFADIQMPEMTGSEMTARIRASERAEGLPAVPIYSLSANAMPGQIASYDAVGMTGHLSKPIRRADLAGAIFRHAPPRRPVPSLQQAS